MAPPVTGAAAWTRYTITSAPGRVSASRRRGHDKCDRCRGSATERPLPSSSGDQPVRHGTGLPRRKSRDSRVGINPRRSDRRHPAATQVRRPRQSAGTAGRRWRRPDHWVHRHAPFPFGQPLTVSGATTTATMGLVDDTTLHSPSPRRSAVGTGPASAASDSVTPRGPASSADDRRRGTCPCGDDWH